MSYGDKAFELLEEEDSHTSDQPPTQQYRRSLIFKKVTFDRLKILKHCVRVRVRFLLDVTCNIEYIMNSLSHYFKEKLQESQSSQYTHFSKKDVLSYVEEFGMPDSDKVYYEMLIKKNDVPMSIPTHNVMSLIYELLYQTCFDLPFTLLSPKYTFLQSSIL